MIYDSELASRSLLSVKESSMSISFWTRQIPNEDLPIEDCFLAILDSPTPHSTMRRTTVSLPFSASISRTTFHW